MKKIKLTHVILGAVLLSTISCQKKPVACFKPYSSVADSIERGTILNFDATCSENASVYNWQIVSRDKDSAIFKLNNSTKLNYTFAEPGKFGIFLYVENPNNKDNYRYSSEFYDVVVK